MVFLRRYIFSHFSTPRTIISDGGSNFSNKVSQETLENYRVKLHKVTTPYYPQTSGKVEVSFLQIKMILAKFVNANQSDQPWKLDQAIWIYHTTCKTPIGIPPYE